MNIGADFFCSKNLDGMVYTNCNKYTIYFILEHHSQPSKNAAHVYKSVCSYNGVPLLNKNANGEK